VSSSNGVGKPGARTVLRAVLLILMLGSCSSGTGVATVAPSSTHTASSVDAPTSPGDTPVDTMASTFILAGSDGSLAVARLADGSIVRVLRTHGTGGAMRAPNGDLLVSECLRPACGDSSNGNTNPWVPDSRDVTTGKTFPGDRASVSPDGSRIATVIAGLCDRASTAAGKSDHCRLYVDYGSIAVRGNQALFNDHNEGQIWLYDGTTARLITNTHDWGATPTW
jgi:hypothetical protein